VLKFSLNRLISRRKLFKIGISSVTALAIFSFGKLKVLSYLIYTITEVTESKKYKIKDNPQRTFRVIGKLPLKKRASAKGLIYGAMPDVEYQKFDRDDKLKSIVIQECSLMVAGVHWGWIQPSEDTFDFTRSDYFAKFAADHQLLLRGHTLVWYAVIPEWLSTKLNHKNAAKTLTNHIQSVVKRYAGRMHSWDVVNEAIEPKDGRSDGLRKNLWLESLGPDYIELAFRTAAHADPKSLLVYNETNLEYEDANQKATLKLLERLKSKGTPIHALGIQSHLNGERQDFSQQKFKRFLRNVADLGLKIMITELDVIDRYLPKDIKVRDRMVASIYEDYLTTVLAEKSVIAVISWGLTDRDTWITDRLPRQDRLPARPLPFDLDGKPKLAWNALARAFDRAPKR
jgi:endo-1,4-beta-xylanase